MGVKKFKPVTPGQRHKIGSNFEGLSKVAPEKSLLEPAKKSGGRNSKGKMTIRHVGGGHKKKYRLIDFKRNKENISATVKSIEYDPNRSAHIALLVYEDGEKRYILAPNGLKEGDKVKAGKGVGPEIGNALYLSEIPLGTIIHNIEMHPGKGGELVRSAGASAQLMSRDGKYAVIKMPSGETRMILVTCKASIGSISNSDHALEISGKAGRSRWLGRRPRTRPVVMNPVDHPMGGGEGKASGGHPRSRNGKPAKGYITRAKKKASTKYILERRKK